MRERLIVRIALALILAMIVLFTASDSSLASTWRGKWRQNCSFESGILENVWITPNGTIQLFVGEYYGNDFVATSRYTSANHLDSPEKQLSLRFEASKSGVLVRIRLYFYQDGRVLNWRVRLETDDGSENHYPSGSLAWVGAQGLVAPDSNGWAIIPIEPGVLNAGQVYHIVVSPVGVPSANNFVNPRATSPFNENWINGNVNFARGVLFSRDEGSTWQLRSDREPVYVLDFADNTWDGNPYFSYTSKSIRGSDVHGESFTPHSDIVAGAVEFFVKRTSKVPVDSLYVVVENSDGVMMLPIENCCPIGSSYGWIRYEFPSLLTFKTGVNYRISLKSPDSDTSGYYYVNFLNTSSGSPYPELSYDGTSSFYVRSNDGGETWSHSSGYADDLAFRLVMTYRERGIFTSSPIDAGANVSWSRVSWVAVQPAGSTLEIQTRTSADSWNWTDWQVCSNGSRPQSPEGRYIQYRAILGASANCVSPTLQSVTIEYLDVTPPCFSDPQPFENQLLVDPMPLIAIVLDDDLSGVDPESTRMLVDNCEVRPTYDSSRREVWYQSPSGLRRGDITVTVTASDFGGNIASYSWSFRVNPAAVSIRQSVYENSDRREKSSDSLLSSGELFLNHVRTGVLMDNISSPPGDGSRTPRDIVVVGDVLWVVDSRTNLLYKMNNAGVTLQELHTPGSNPCGIAWDNHHLWHSDGETGLMYKIQPEALENIENLESAVIDTWQLPTSNPAGLTWGDGHLWILSDTTGDEAIYKLTTSGRTVKKIEIPSSSPEGLAWDRGRLWYSDSRNDEIYWISTSGEILASFPSPGRTPRGIAANGDCLWLLDSSDDAIYTLHPFEYEPTTTYTSQVIDTGDEVKWDIVQWEAETPENTSIIVEVRISNNGTEWSDWHRCTNRSPLPGPRGRYIQYRVVLSSLISSRTPSLRDLEFTGVDSAPPIISHLEPPHQGFANNPRTTISAIVHDRTTWVDSSSVTVTIDNQPVENWIYDTETGQVSFSPLSRLEDGTHSVKIRAVDAENNATDKIWTFTIDTVAPIITITRPCENYRTSEDQVTLRGITNDPSATILINETQIQNNKNHTFETTVKLEEGLNTIVASTTDLAGNIALDTIHVRYEHPEDPLTWGTLLILIIGIGTGATLASFGKKLSLRLRTIVKIISFRVNSNDERPKVLDLENPESFRKSEILPIHVFDGLDSPRSYSASSSRISKVNAT